MTSLNLASFCLNSGWVLSISYTLCCVSALTCLLCSSLYLSSSFSLSTCSAFSLFTLSLCSFSSCNCLCSSSLSWSYFYLDKLSMRRLKSALFLCKLFTNCWACSYSNCSCSLVLRWSYFRKSARFITFLCLSFYIPSRSLRAKESGSEIRSRSKLLNVF